MNAVFIHKRNESVHRMWACLAGAEVSVMILSSDLAQQETVISIILDITFVLAVVSLGFAAPVYYFFACKHCLNAKKNPKASLGAGVVLAMAVISFFVVSIVTCSSAYVALHLVLPVTFALSALPLKLIPDRA